MSQAATPEQFRWLASNGDQVQRVREIDWSRSSLGPVDRWSAALRTSFGTCLDCAFPIIVWWGPELALLYNEEYRPCLGAKHPSALGQPGATVWAEIWDVIGPMLGKVMSSGEATRSRDLRLHVERHGYLEETYWSFSYSPIIDDDGRIGGVFCPVIETTDKIIAERRLRTLRDLAAECKGQHSETATHAAAAQVLATNPEDLPFALIYRIDEDQSVAVLEAAVGIDAGAAAAPLSVELEFDTALSWPLAAAVNTGRAAIIDDLARRFGTLPPGRWNVGASSALVLPLLLPGQERPRAVLVAAVSPLRALDSDYRTFFDLVANQISSGLADAQALAEERRRTQALAEIDRAKTVFFSNVSHELRTPLTLILGPLEDALAEPEAAWPRERVELVHRNTRRLQKLVNTLLDFSRIEAGRVQARYEPTALAELVAELASVFRSAIEKAGLRLTVDCPPLPEPVHVDRDMIEKIVLNLLSNAFKFTLHGEIAVSVRDAGDAVELCVRDTGCGIAPEQQPRVFERFRRVEGAQARTFEGSGIGLALVQELARLHGGRVTVESGPGQGSTFRVTLPKGSAHLPVEQLVPARAPLPAALAAEPFLQEALGWLPLPAGITVAASDDAVVHAPVEETGPAAARPRILWADDNADMRDYVLRLLQPRYAVEAVADGAAALAAARRQRPDLVLSDVMMPRLDGFGLLRALREDAATRTVPVILLSARAGEEAQLEGLQAGADDYLVKPFSAKELLARLSAHLGMAQLRREHERHAAADLAAMTRLYDMATRCVQAGAEQGICLQDIVDAAVAVSGADKGMLQLVDGEPARLRIAAQQGLDEAFLSAVGTVYEGDACVCATALKTRQCEVVEDVATSPLFAGRPALAQLLASGIRAIQSTPLIDGSGAVLGIVTTYWSVPTRPAERELRRVGLLARHAADYFSLKQGETVLRDSEQRFRALTDATADVVFRMSADWSEVLSVQGRNFIADTLEPHRAWLERYIHVDDHPQMSAAVAQALASRQVFELEHRVIRIDGTPGWAYSRAVPIVDAQGNILEWFGAASDVTPRKQTEHALHVSEQHLRAIIEQLPAGVGVADTDGRWTLSNSLLDSYVPQAVPSFLPERIPQWQAWDEAGQPIPPQDWPGRRALRGESVMPGTEMLHTASDGRQSWMRVSAAPLRNGGPDVIGACVVMQDVTVVKNAEHVLREADRRKDEFLATLAHELRNPLAPIRTGLQVLKATRDSAAATRIHDMLDRQVSHMVRLVDDLMEVSRITGGKVELRKEPVDVASVLRSAVETSRPLVEAARHRLSISLPGEALILDADPVRLTQVVANLLNNAAKYTEDGGHIWLEAHREGNDAVIRVRDSGIGIPEAMLPKVFDLFTQVERTYHRAQGGLGIGLTLVRSLVDMHGGRVDAASDGENQGSEFRVRLPLAPAARAGNSGSGKPASSGNVAPQRILVVDDNRDAAESLGLLLSVLGAQVRVVNDGAAGLAALHAERPDVMMLDIGMPGMDGHELARRAREQLNGDPVTLIALTGWGQQEDRRRSEEAGIDHHLVKPVDVAELEQLLAAIEAKREARRGGDTKG